MELEGFIWEKAEGQLGVEISSKMSTEWLSCACSLSSYRLEISKGFVATEV